MIVLGITGSIAMGKSTASTMLSHLNNPIHDADKTVHELMSVNGKAYNEIAKSFPETIQVDGVDRTKLGHEVFGNPEKLKQLENICLRWMKFQMIYHQFFQMLNLLY